MKIRIKLFEYFIASHEVMKAKKTLPFKSVKEISELPIAEDIKYIILVLSNNIYFKGKQNYEEKDLLNPRNSSGLNSMFYLYNKVYNFKKKYDIPNQLDTRTSLLLVYPYELIMVNFYIKITYEELLNIYNLAQELGKGLFNDKEDEITLKYLEQFKIDEEKNGLPKESTKLNKLQKEVLVEIANDFKFIYIKQAAYFDVLNYFDKNAVQSICEKSFKKVFDTNGIGMVQYENELMLYGANWERLIGKRYGKLENSFNLFLSDLSKRYGDVQYYAYHENEIAYALNSSGTFMCSGLNNGKNQIYNDGSMQAPFISTKKELIAFASENGVDVIQFLTKCFLLGIKSKVIEGPIIKNYLEKK